MPFFSHVSLRDAQGDSAWHAHALSLHRLRLAHSGFLDGHWSLRDVCAHTRDFEPGIPLYALDKSADASHENALDSLHNGHAQAHSYVHGSWLYRHALSQDLSHTWAGPSHHRASGEMSHVPGDEPWPVLQHRVA